MRKMLLALALGLGFNSTVKAQNWVIDSVNMGSGCTTDVFYSLSNSTIKNENNRNWHLAFSMSAADSSAIWANHSTSNNWVKVFNIHKDTTQWANISLADTVGADLCFNNDNGWFSGALNNKPGTNPFDFGWGKYNPVSHNIEGDSIFIVRTPQGYFKLWIKDLVSTQMVYTFRVGHLTNNTDTVYTVSKQPNYTDRIFAYVDLSNGKDTNREPAITTWDFLFTRYTTNAIGRGQMPNNNVIGVLTNKTVKVAQAIPVHVDTAYAQYANFIATWTPGLAGIGYSWKTFDLNNNAWLTPDSNSYFIQDRAGNLWQLQFTGFSGSATGKVNFRKRMVVPTSINDINSAIDTYAFCPNPANEATRLVLTAKENTQASLRVVDMQGRCVATSSLSINNGLNAFSIPTQYLAGGLYTIVVQGNGITIKEKIQVRH
ncbi:MAG: T9SS type A sorting domain-containing protein [Chitinophagaceae bacterium]|nr:T9SS type A sorting domain-containing protein [Chitinophagaceae bacterium]